MLKDCLRNEAKLVKEVLSLIEGLREIESREFEDELELLMEPFRCLSLRSLRSPIFSTGSSTHDRSAVNMALELYLTGYSYRGIIVIRNDL